MDVVDAINVLLDNTGDVVTRDFVNEIVTSIGKLFL